MPTKPIRLFMLALAVCSLFADKLRAERPNIVVMLADDLGWSDVAFHGGNAPTPTLDRLAREGLELAQHYVAPVCSPTRTGFMTGRCWSRFGVTNPQNHRALPWATVTLPRALKSVGYDTCLTGKWHLGSLPDEGPNHLASTIRTVHWLAVSARGITSISRGRSARPGIVMRNCAKNPAMSPT